MEIVVVLVVLVVGGLGLLGVWAAFSLLRSDTSLARSYGRLARQRQAEADQLAGQKQEQDRPPE